MKCRRDSAASRPLRRLPRDGESGLSDVVGSILLVAITVVMAGAFAILLFQYDGPEKVPDTRLALTLGAGQGGWGTGDESIRIVHNGGDALNASAAQVVYRINANTTSLMGTQLGGAFADGKLTLGETWTRTVRLAATDTVTVSLLNHGAATGILATATMVPGQLPSTTTCLFDTNPPLVAAWNQTPSDVRSTTLGAVTVTATLSDDCFGVNQTATPELWWRINDGTNPAFAKASPDMALIAPNTWRGAVPSAAWATMVGQTLEYEVRNMKDLGGRTGTSSRQADLVDLVSTYTYPASHVDYVGTSADFANMQSASDSAAVATFTEVTTQSSTLPGTSATAIAGASNPSFALICADANRATLGATGQGVDVTGFSAPPGATGISRITISLVGQRSSGGSSPDPSVTLRYTLGATAGVSTLAITSWGTSDQTSTLDITGDRSWVVADIANLHVIASATNIGSRTALVNCLSVTVTYAPGTVTNYALRERLDFTGVPVGTTGTRTLQMSYRTTGDTYSVLVWDWTAGKFNSRGTLNSATLASFTYVLTADEYSSGNVQVRLADNTPTGSSAGTLVFDYARVAST